MPAQSCRRGRIVGILTLLLVMVVPIAHQYDAKAATDLVIGADAIVSNAQGDNVNLRDQPSFSGNVLTSVPEGDFVTVVDGPFTDDSDGTTWYQITTTGQTGYMLSDYLSADDSVSAAAVVTTTANVNFRSGPGTGYSVIQVIPRNSSVNTTGAVQNGFTRLTYNGVTGWVASQYLSGSGDLGTATVNSGPLNLRSAPNTTSTVVALMPVGATVTITGSLTNGFYPVTYNGTAGYAFAEYLTRSSTQTATVINANLNLRSGASTTTSVLLVIPRGSTVTITGGLTNGFYPVTYNGTAGYASATYLQIGGTTPVAGTGYTTANLRMRSTPSTSGGILQVIPKGSPVTITGNATSGFYPARYGGISGYVSTSYITFTPPAGGGLIVWPVSGGAWTVIQGYNGSSHQNDSDLWQYLYSLDIAREDGQTAGVQAFSPVSGTVRWYERATGGITIDMGNGYAVAMFHLTVDRSWEPGDTIRQGEFIGTVSDVGGEGFQQVPHIHFTLWQTNDGGNWNRVATPFTGAYAISGTEFPSNGSTYQWTGFDFNP